MIKYLFICVFYSFLSISILNAKDINSTDSTGLPGDNFCLEGALELFKKAGSPEEFEKMLNTQGSYVNNLDLNEDGETDYIKVIDKSQENIHTFILQDAVSETENQDIAVIELEKSGDASAILQIVGDEDIYGEEAIIEPLEEIQTNTDTNTLNVWSWPTVQYVYNPSYITYASSMAWRSRPAWWQPWKPVHYSSFYPNTVVYRKQYVAAQSHKTVAAPKMYKPVRVSSATVTARNKEAIKHYRANLKSSSKKNEKRINRRSATVTGKKKSTVTKKTTIVKGKKN